MENSCMLFILGLILFITIKLYSNWKKTDELIFQIYKETILLSAFVRRKDKLENNKIWMDGLNNSYSKDKYGDPMDWKWVNKEEEK